MAGDRPWRSAGDPKQDWPVLIHAMVCVRKGAGTTGWLHWVDTVPPNKPEERLKVSYESPSRSRSTDDMVSVLETMIKQLRRQQALREESRR